MRRLLSLLSCALLISGSSWASTGIIFDQAGNCLRFTATTEVTLAKSLDGGQTFGPARTLYQLSPEAGAASLNLGQDGATILTYLTSGDAYCAVAQNNSAWFAPPVKISVEAVSAATITTDQFGRVHGLIVTRNHGKRLLYANLPQLASLEASFEAKVVTETGDDIINPLLTLSPWGIAVAWQTHYLERQETFLKISLDGGQTFGRTKTVAFGGDLAGLAFRGDKWLLVSNGPTPLFTPLPEPPVKAALPLILSPTKDQALNTLTPEVVFATHSLDPVICRLDLSADRSFPKNNTYNFEFITQPTPEAVYRLPVDLIDSPYFIRLALFDGYTTGAYSSLESFRIDRLPPRITLLAPTAESSDSFEITVSGQIDGTARLTLNGQIITTEADGSFKTGLTLSPGNNPLLLVATDEALNSSQLARTITFSSDRPQLSLLKPKAGDWFKPGSACLIELTVKDLQGDIEDESEAELRFNGQLLEDKLTYDQQAGKLSGFITLPQELLDGQNRASVSLRDAAGNTGEKEWLVNLDHLPPVLTLVSGEAAYSRSPWIITLPLTDEGAGIDPLGTIVRLAGISLEVSPSGEVYAKTFLLDGSYEVEVMPRDRIGNNGPAQKYPLIVDTRSPSLRIESSEAVDGQPYILLKGEAEDDHLGLISIYNNDRLVDSFQPDDRHFVRQTPLEGGNNSFRIEAADRAGNTTVSSFTILTSVQAAALVNRAGYAPNPFSPRSDGELAFTYNLSAPAELKFYLFDLSGALVWKKELSNATAGVVRWNGRDHFGGVAPNGVYIYLLQVSANGSTEIKRGKVIVL
ncbi:MAG: hypothetical protein WC632_02650 [Candidatus Margulisiibacteriota bacterium]